MPSTVAAQRLHGKRGFPVSAAEGTPKALSVLLLSDFLVGLGILFAKQQNSSKVKREKGWDSGAPICTTG